MMRSKERGSGMKKILYLIWTFFFLYRGDKTNPYRRYCKRCGDIQEVWSYDGMYGQGYWVFSYEPLVEKCLCHKRCDEKAAQSIGL